MHDHEDLQEPLQDPRDLQDLEVLDLEDRHLFSSGFWGSDETINQPTWPPGYRTKRATNQGANRLVLATTKHQTDAEASRNTDPEYDRLRTGQLELNFTSCMFGLQVNAKKSRNHADEVASENPPNNGGR